MVKVVRPKVLSIGMRASLSAKGSLGSSPQLSINDKLAISLLMRVVILGPAVGNRKRRPISLVVGYRRTTVPFSPSAGRTVGYWRLRQPKGAEPLAGTIVKQQQVGVLNDPCCSSSPHQEDVLITVTVTDAGGDA